MQSSTQTTGINPENELLTVEEVAKYLKISRKTVYSLKRRGKLHFYKIAGTINRISRSELADLINGTQPA